MARPFAKKFYSSKAWQACRDEYAKEKRYLCERCLARGLYVLGEIVHHKIEVTPDNVEHPEIVLNFNNLELLCRKCHAEVHKHSGYWSEVIKEKRERRRTQRYKIGADGKIFPSEPPLVVLKSEKS